MDMEIFWAFFWALMAADAVFLSIVAVVLIGWKVRQSWCRRDKRKTL